MSIEDYFKKPEPEPEDLPLAEEAALHTPPLWEPAHVEPEGITPLPSDFPVLDPFAPEDEEVRTNRAYLHEILARDAKCKVQNCALDDTHALAEQCAAASVEALGAMQSCAATLYAHGEELLGEVLLDAVAAIAGDILLPYFERAGLTDDDD